MAPGHDEGARRTGGCAPARFVAAHAGGLLLAGVLLVGLSRDGRVDFALTRLAYDPAVGFILQQHPLLAALGHDAMRRLSQGAWVTACVLMLASFRSPGLSRWRAPLAYTTLAVLVSAALVALLKQASAHSCPWDLIEFGGPAQWFPLLDAAPGRQSGPGRCWPGGHASGGFAWIAVVFALRDRAPKAARVALAIVLVVGAAMSLVQVLRGAHFPSHNLWTLWLCWATCAALYAIWPGLSRRNDTPIPGNPGR